MPKIPFPVGIVVATFFLPGCSQSGLFFRDSAKPSLLVMTPELRTALKVAYGNSIPEDQLTVELQAARTLDAELRKVGAKLAADGKMHDRNGKEIYLWSNGPGLGMRRDEADLWREQEQRKKAFEETCRHYTVIDVGYWGPHPP